MPSLVTSMFPHMDGRAAAWLDIEDAADHLCHVLRRDIAVWPRLITKYRSAFQFLRFYGEAARDWPEGRSWSRSPQSPFYVPLYAGSTVLRTTMVLSIYCANNQDNTAPRRTLQHLLELISNCSWPWSAGTPATTRLERAVSQYESPFLKPLDSGRRTGGKENTVRAKGHTKSATSHTRRRAPGADMLRRQPRGVRSRHDADDPGGSDRKISLRRARPLRHRYDPWRRAKKSNPPLDYIQPSRVAPVQGRPSRSASEAIANEALQARRDRVPVT
jgi:hypothetical protein